MSQHRDLIILTKSRQPDVDELEKQVRSINALLYHVESLEVFCEVTEVIDINRYKIITAPYLVRKTIADRIQPFVFLLNKN